MIPAKIIQNWDFQLYPVCNVHKRFLDEVFSKPLIDLRKENSKLYRFISPLGELQSLRTQLHYIQAYLFTCQHKESVLISEGSQSSFSIPACLTPAPGVSSSPVDTHPFVPIAGQELRQQLWPKEHLYEHVHLYSINDLHEVYKGSLVPLIKQAVDKGRVHIMRCPRCFPRGFICELCRDKTILFPFQLRETYTCSNCNGVFHKHCFEKQTDCPKCARRLARQNRQKEEEEDEDS